jgi:hypothetical protein
MRIGGGVVCAIVSACTNDGVDAGRLPGGRIEPSLCGAPSAASIARSASRVMPKGESASAIARTSW